MTLSESVMPRSVTSLALACGVLLATASPVARAGTKCSATELRLPAGFCSSVFADAVGRARHLTISPAGDVYVMLWGYVESPPAGSIVALRDSTNDGIADTVTRFGERGGDDIEWREGYLYASTRDSIVRYKSPSGQFVPAAAPETVIRDIPTFPNPEHESRTFAFVGNRLLVHVGAPSNSCQERNRQPNSPGLRPCPFREGAARISEFPADAVSIPFSQGEPYVQGVRHSMGLDLSPSGRLYAIIHGRDELHINWPDVYSEQQGADLPADELAILNRGDDLGWPFCYFDPIAGERRLAPEYAGDGKKVGDCARYRSPALAIPAHSAPNDLLFYRGSQFPEHFRGGAFIALHGGWGRKPFVQNGYKVVYVPFTADAPGLMEAFADGFAGRADVSSPEQATFRPVGLAESSDGSLYISDSKRGRIWKIWYGT